ncbi:MAG: hypothetical protein HY000_06275, partial [Planctomycetes bacterium]|nr:hypothetical protein [Planctomycetota bacterium]
MRVSIKPQLCVWLVGALAVALLGVWAWYETVDTTPGNHSPNAVPVQGADLTVAASPYLNVRPEVRYVGSETCARCHAEQAGTYHDHPMGRSVASAADAPATERLDPAAGNPFNADGHHYSVERRDGRMFHREVRVDDQGRALWTVEEEIAWVVGAGDHGRSYLINRDGSLFQSPIGWYPQQQIWALSPGYETVNEHFNRPIQSECLFCHSTFADHVSGTIGRYREPIFRERAIGCERCHGPGELHVARHEGERSEVRGQRSEVSSSDFRSEISNSKSQIRNPQSAIRNPPVPQPIDPTIVNPRHLSPKLREAV